MIKASRRNLVKGLAAASAGLLLALPGCMSMDEPEHIASDLDGFEDFAAQVYQEPDTGVYIVDGDTPLETLEQLRQFYDDHMRGGALALHRPGGVDAAWDDVEKLNLTYCVSNTFGANYGVVVSAMANATAAWEAEADVDFIHLAGQDGACTAANNNVVFDVRPVSGQPYLARAFFPNYARANRNILIDSSSFGGNLPWSLAGILRHEVGHTLGFRHEHTRPEAGVCFENNDWRPLTDYDSASVMHYPQCNGTNAGDLDITRLDGIGARSVYGSRSAWGWVWAQSATGTYAASAPYSRNSSGGPTGVGVVNTVTQLGTGSYRVDFPDLGATIGGNVQVTAYGEGNERCKVSHWNSSAGTLRVFVVCHTPAGAAVDTRFVASYVRKDEATVGDDEAYLWLFDSTAANSVPPLTYQWNSSGAANSVERLSPGVYRAVLPGMAPAPRGGTVQVTAYGATSHHCKVQSWGPSGGNMQVNVRCFDAAGAAADSMFTLLYSSSWAAGGPSGGHAWAHDPTAAAYAPLDYWEYIELGGLGANVSHTSATRSGVGLYGVTYPTLPATGSTALVTAYGTGPEYCKVRSWTGSPASATVSIGCFDAAGAATDTRFVSGYSAAQFHAP